MLHPKLGNCSDETSPPTSTASRAARRSTSCHWQVVARPASVELSSINEPAIPVKQKEIRGTGSSEDLRDPLCPVKEEGEFPTFLLAQFLHVTRPILRVSLYGIGIDGDNGHATWQIVTGDVSKLRSLPM
jgi:hypothetical protein